MLGRAPSKWGTLNNQHHIYTLHSRYLLVISPFKGLQQGGSTARGPPSQDIPPSTKGSKDEFPEWSRIISMAGIQPANVG